MPAKIRLYIRPSLPDGNRPFLDPVFTANRTNRRLKPGFGILDGREQRFEKIVYYVRYLRNGKRVWELVGSDASLALVQQRKIKNRLEGVALGNIKEGDEPEAKPQPQPTPELTPEPQPEAATESVRDAALIAAAQRVEHYEMASYGAMRHFAQILGEPLQAQLLDKTLQEEGHADHLLTQIANRVNPYAEKGSLRVSEP